MTDKLRWFESGSHVLTFLISAATMFGVASGALIAEWQYEPYGIHFLEMAAVDDYIRVAAKHVLLLLLFVVVIMLGRRLWQMTRDERLHPVKASLIGIVALAILLYAVPRYVALFDIDTALNQDKPVSQVELHYGFSEHHLSCLQYITRTGNFLHFWSTNEQRLVSVNQQKVSVIKAQQGCPATSS